MGYTGWISTVEGWTFRNAAGGSGWNLRTPEGADVTDGAGNLWTFTDIGDLVTFVATASAPEGV